MSCGIIQFNEFIFGATTILKLGEELIDMLQPVGHGALLVFVNKVLLARAQAVINMSVAASVL